MCDLDLSIYMATYNHEKYVSQAIESVIMQKTNYSYELLIGDDASQDSTQSIIEIYRKKYPHIIKTFYRDHNMNGEIPNNAADLRARCSGKYVIALEGDDYWTDESKLEKQLKFLESHPEYIAVAHNCIVVDQNSKPLEEKYPECKESGYTLKKFSSGILPGQLATVMYRNFLYMKDFDASILKKGLTPGDKLLYFSLAAHGNIYCMQECMSAYRHVTNGGSSFSANYQFDFKKIEKWNRELLTYAYALNNKEAEQSAELYYIRYLFGARRKRLCSLSDFREDIKNIRHKGRATLAWLTMKINNQF